MSIAHLGLAEPPAAGDRGGWQGERTPPHDLLAEQSALGGRRFGESEMGDRHG